jgi:hypothetical protein
MTPTLKPGAIPRSCPEYPEPHLYHYEFPPIPLASGGVRPGFDINFESLPAVVTPCPYQDWQTTP